MSESMQVKHNTSTEVEILEHLRRVDSLFVPTLSSRVTLGEYSRKLRAFGETIELWSGASIVGLVAGYVNGNGSRSFLSSVSIESQLWGQGWGRRLLIDLIDLSRSVQSDSLDLEVSESSFQAVSMYRSLGFTVENRTPEGMYLMSLNLRFEVAISYEC